MRRTVWSRPGSAARAGRRRLGVLGVRAACGILRQSRKRQRQIAADHRHDAAARLFSRTMKQDAEHNNFELRAVARERWEARPASTFLSSDDDGCADTAPAIWPAPPTSAMSRSSMPGRMSKGVGIHETLHVRIEPARQAGEQAGENEDGKPRAEEVDREAFHHGDAAAQAADGAALAANPAGCGKAASRRRADPQMK